MKINTRKKTKLEVYAYTIHGSISEFALAMDISYVCIWKWIRKKSRPSVRIADRIESRTHGNLTVDYLRNSLR